MTNLQCQAYAVIAVRNLIRDGVIKVKKLTFQTMKNYLRLNN